MSKIFLDTNVILDVLAKRIPHYKYSASVFNYIVQKIYIGYLSSLSFSNLHYIMSKYGKNKNTKQILKKLYSVVEVISVDSKIINQALNSKFNDFEDAIQYYSAISIGADYIITRNIKDYKSSDIPTYLPEEFLKSIIKNDL